MCARKESPMNRKVLVAAAWPYVNGSLHLGHVAGLLPADILARYHRAKGDSVLFVSGSDCHGTPILVTADRQGKSPAEIAQHYHDEFVATLIGGLGFTYSLYTKTMGEFHQRVAQEIFTRIHADGYMASRAEEQPFCGGCKRFLPDRYIEGGCPNCAAANARGDQCEQCGTLMEPRTLVNPHCRTCGATPIWQSSTHLYFQLPKFEQRLREWTSAQEGWRTNAIAMTEGWFTRGLQDRPVTRDLEWGIPVPVDGFTDKRIYVWFEAVMGYLSCSKEWAAASMNPEAWREWWENPDALHYYVHGKDNIPFHTIIWPAMLMALGLHLPDRIVSSEYLNFGDKKQSKSAGTAISLPSMLERFEPDAIRFFLTTQGPETKDTKFDWKEFRQHVNGDLIGRLGNFWNRTYAMANRYFGGIPSAVEGSEESRELRAAAQRAFDDVSRSIERSEFRLAVQQVLALADAGNQYLARRQPWAKVATDRGHAEETIRTACVVAESLRRLAAPFIPHVADRLNAYLGASESCWEFRVPEVRPLAKPDALIHKIEQSEIDAVTAGV